MCGHVQDFEWSHTLSLTPTTNEQAELARCESEVAVGCVIVDSRTGEVIGRGRNATNASKNVRAPMQLCAPH
jgi:tRNA(Arg) A34 adenosine deaminase TadA